MLKRKIVKQLYLLIKSRFVLNKAAFVFILNARQVVIQHSQIIPRIPFCRPNILPHISPESQYHIDNNRRAHRKDGGIHKILPDFTGRNSHPVANGRTNAKGIPLHKAFEFVHIANLENLGQQCNIELFRQVFFRTFAAL